MLVGGCLGLIAAVIASPTKARQAAGQTWPPFVLVTGLLMIGVAAHRDGLFDALGSLAGRVRAHPAVRLVALLMLVATVTAVLNLDTSVAFLTPVLIVAARNGSVDEEPFLYGTLLMSNAASLLLPGSNLTNLLVLAHQHISGAAFAARMLPAWIAAVAVTAGFSVFVHRHLLHRARPHPDPRRVSVPITWSSLAVAVAVVFMLVLRSPAVPVLLLGAALATRALHRHRMSAAEIGQAVQPATLVGVFCFAVALGTVARSWGGPSDLMVRANGAETAAIGAVTAVLINNLPAAVLLGPRGPAHPRALLLGLNIGPNLAVTGSLSALIWYRAATTIGARPSAARLSRLGMLVVPVSMAVALVALGLFSSGLH